MVRPGEDCDHGYDHGCTFADDQTGYGKVNSGLHVMLSEKIVDQINRTYAEELLRQLRYSRDGGLADTVKITVNAGVRGRHGNGQGDNAKEGRCSAFQKEGCGDGIGV